jgi:hypothetical protein
MRQPFSSLLLCAALTGAAPLSAQQLTLDTGAEVEWGEVTLSGTNLQAKVRKPDGTESIAVIPASKVVRVSWPYPQELTDALSLILAQKYDAARAKASEVRTIHGNWKDKPGSWYVQSTLLVAETWLRSKNEAEADKLITELKTMTLTSSQQKALLMVDAQRDFERNATTPALDKALRAAQGLDDDSALLARIQLLIGDIRIKQEQYTDALDAYLQIPVFFGAEGHLMPVAELGAARALFGMKRLADASKAYANIIMRYKGTPEAAISEKEKLDVDKVISGGAPGEKPSEEKSAEEKPSEEQK